MSTGIATRPPEPLPEAVESLLATGDLKQLTTAQRIQYYKARCDAAGLDPRTRPFEYILLNGKLVLYALKSCADSLSGKHGLSFEIVALSFDNGLYQVIGRVKFPDGRETTDMGVVPIKGLAGNDLANAMMKATTKAKRRATLSACGLGDVMDETEVESMANVRMCNENGTPKALENNSGHASGMYASVVQAASYLESMDKWLLEANTKWLDYWSSATGGEIPKEVKEVNRWQADKHLVKWAMETGRLEEGSVDETGPKNRQIGLLTAIVYHRDKASRGALARELRRYVEEQQGRQMEAVRAKRPELVDGSPDDDLAANDEAMDAVASQQNGLGDEG